MGVLVGILPRLGTLSDSQTNRFVDDPSFVLQSISVRLTMRPTFTAA